MTILITIVVACVVYSDIHCVPYCVYSLITITKVADSCSSRSSSSVVRFVAVELIYMIEVYVYTYIIER